MAADQIACQIQSYSQMHSWEPVQNLRKINPMQCIMIFEDNELLLNVQVNQLCSSQEGFLGGDQY